MIDVNHLECQGVAFRLKEPWEAGALLKASNVVLVNGTRPPVNSIVKCGNCHARVGGLRRTVTGFYYIVTLGRYKGGQKEAKYEP